MRRTLLVLVCLLAAGCGGGPGSVVSDTASKLGDIKSGDLTLSFRAEGGGGRVGFDLAGPFQLAEPGALPVARLDYTQIAGAKQATVTFISTGEKAYAETNGKTYLLPAAQAEKLRAIGGGGETGSGGLGSLDIDGWLVDPKMSGGGTVGGTETDHIVAKLDVVQALNDLLGVMSAVRGNVERRIEGNDAEAVRRAVRNASIDVWTGKDDRLLRRLVVDLQMSANVPARVRDGLGALGQADVHFELGIADPNEPVHVEAPANAEPLPAG